SIAATRPTSTAPGTTPAMSSATCSPRRRRSSHRDECVATPVGVAQLAGDAEEPVGLAEQGPGILGRAFCSGDVGAGLGHGGRPGRPFEPDGGLLCDAQLTMRLLQV